MKVRATQKGYYDNKLRNEGEVFVLKTVHRTTKDANGKKQKVPVPPEKQYSSIWMEEVKDGERKALPRRFQEGQGPAKAAHEPDPEQTELTDAEVAEALDQLPDDGAGKKKAKNKEVI